MNILVTGGAGYIGSHTCVELLEADHKVVVVDNLSNSDEEALRRVQSLTDKPLEFRQVDLLDKTALGQVFRDHAVDMVIHFAGLKAVGESVNIPLDYYHNNITGTLNLLQAMAEAGVKSLVFSSSATVYGDPTSVPIREDFPLGATNPYGRTKQFIEDILNDLVDSDPQWGVVLLRYFNPTGAHASGQIGEDPKGIPNNLMPYIAQVASGKLDRLNVFGDDYNTPDGTGVRDYIHVVDLARGHLAAINKLSLDTTTGVYTYNLGTGQGYSVLDMVRAFEAETGKHIPYQVTPRRPGDIATCYADPSLAKNELDWSAKHGIRDMVKDLWCWQSNNPRGYRHRVPGLKK